MITPDQIKEIYTQILEALRVVKIASMSGIWDLLEFEGWEILEVGSGRGAKRGVAFAWKLENSENGAKKFSKHSD